MAATTTHQMTNEYFSRSDTQTHGISPMQLIAPVPITVFPAIKKGSWCVAIIDTELKTWTCRWDCRRAGEGITPAMIEITKAGVTARHIMLFAAMERDLSNMVWECADDPELSRLFGDEGQWLIANFSPLADNQALRKQIGIDRNVIRLKDLI
jgi:hypothetical protein